MPLQPHAASMFRDSVYPLALAEGVEATGGILEVFPPPGITPLKCHVDQERVMGGFGGGGEQSMTTVSLSFPADPGTRKGDRFLFRGRVIRATAPSRFLGDDVLWGVDGEIID